MVASSLSSSRNPSPNPNPNPNPNPPSSSASASASPPRPPSPETIFTQSIVPNLPLLMYGSGDVHPTQIDDATTHLVATLTTNYVQKLVEAAVDAHDILTDGAGGVLPPPKFTKRKRDDWADDDNDNNRNNRNRPRPRIKHKTVKTEGSGSSISGTSKTATAAATAATAATTTTTVTAGEEVKKISDEEWQGVKGIDLYENLIRKDYNSIPGTIGAQSFIFPICHDAELYNRVKELTAFENDELKVGIKKYDTPVPTAGGSNKIGALIDSTMLDCIRDEEKDLDHLANSVFHWVGDIKTSSSSIAPTGTGKSGATSAASAAATAAAKAEEKKATEIAIAKRKEMARRLVNRTRLEAQLPGVEDILVPLHSVHDHSSSSSNA